ncbi:hypothetical protein ACHAXT_000510 [Thalassiosira profunda]
MAVSPDSVAAATDAGPSGTVPLAVTNSASAASDDGACGGVMIPSYPSQGTSPHNANEQPARARAPVKNPYLKEKSPSDPVVLDSKTRKRQAFIDRYRREAASATSRGGHAASSTSALDMMRSTQQWRRSWREMSSASNGPSSTESRGSASLRPRLFLFRRHAPAKKQMQQQMHRNQTQGDDGMIERPTTQQQLQQHEGVWELGPGITELSGEGGAGKTQICLNLCVTCAMTPLLFPGDDGASDAATYTALYVTMGEGIPSGTIAMRMEKIAAARLARDDPNETKDVLSRIGLLSIRNEEEFVDFVEQDLPQLLENHNRHQKIGIVAFDGIAGFFRFRDPLFQHSRNSMFHIQRSARFLRVSSQLRRLSDAYDVPILITNQVTASIAPETGVASPDPLSFPMNPEQVEPALGLAWSNCVTTRYILQRKDGMIAAMPKENASVDQTKGGGDRKPAQREMRVRKARVLQSVNTPAEREVYFVIDTGHVVAIS